MPYADPQEIPCTADLHQLGPEPHKSQDSWEKDLAQTLQRLVVIVTPELRVQPCPCA